MFMTAARERVVSEFKECVMNVGQVHFQPGSYNIVPRQAQLAVEYRAPTKNQMGALEAVLLEEAALAAEAHNLSFSTKLQGCIDPSPCAPEIQFAFAEASEILGLKSKRLVSGAGHDTMSLSQICPSGMIFIPSTGGSHNPSEHAEWEDCLNGANTILHAVLSYLDRYHR